MTQNHSEKELLDHAQALMELDMDCSITEPRSLLTRLREIERVWYKANSEYKRLGSDYEPKLRVAYNSVQNRLWEIFPNIPVKNLTSDVTFIPLNLEGKDDFKKESSIYVCIAYRCKFYQDKRLIRDLSRFTMLAPKLPDNF